MSPGQLARPAVIGWFRPADPQWGLARLALLPEVGNVPDEPLDPITAEGILLSSDLYLKSGSTTSRRRRLTERAYQARARHRTTPQGVFAAVAELDVDPNRTCLRMGRRQCTRSYPSPDWLCQVCAQLLEDGQVLRNLIFTTNNRVTRRGARIEVEHPSVTSITSPEWVSVRYTQAVATILDTCRLGAGWYEILRTLVQKWPSLPHVLAETTVRSLARLGFLLTDLIPPNVCEDPLEHVISKLPRTQPLREQLSRLRATLIEADRYKIGGKARLTALNKARQICDGIVTAKRPILVDTACEANVRLAAQLVEQAARAADVLWSCAPNNDPLADWHERFIHRFGTHRLVSLLDACDPVTGLGYGINTPRRPPLRTSSSEILTNLLIDAVASGSIEVRLDDSIVDALGQRENDDRPPASIELYARVVAASPRHRDAGDFMLVVSGVASPAGATRARFCDLLPQTQEAHKLADGPLEAEIVFQPRAYSAASLTGRVDAFSPRIPIGVPPRQGDLLPEELAVVSDGRRLYLWSVVHERLVQPVHHNRIGHHLMPPLAAWLCLVGQQGTVPVVSWQWGPLRDAPFLPRVRYGKVILSPARWKLPPAVLAAAADASTWEAAIRRWRDRSRPALPRVVVTDSGDRRLPLDLDHHDDRELLRRYARRGLSFVAEPPGGSEATTAVVPGPRGYHGLEVILPLHSTSHGAASAPSVAWRRSEWRAGTTGLFLPGGPWLSVAISAPRTTQDTVLARIARVASESVGSWDRWFWLRYATNDLGEHLRVRFHGLPSDLNGRLFPALGQCCKQLLEERLAGSYVVQPYDQEIERYGGPEAIEAVEEVFYRDSELVLAILAEQSDHEARLIIAAVSAAAIVRAVAPGDPTGLGPCKLQGNVRRDFSRLRCLARAVDNTDPPFAELWYARNRALVAYRDKLPVPRRATCASSLIHMHTNRLIGDNEAERMVRALAKDLIVRVM